MGKTGSPFKVFCLFFVVLIIGLGIGAPLAFAETYQYSLQAGAYEIKDVENGYQEIEMEGFGQLLDPGKPKLPSKIFSIAIPPGVKVESVEATGVGLMELEGKYRIGPAPMVSALSASEDQVAQNRFYYEGIVSEAYATDTPYPGKEGVFKQQGAYRKYNLVHVRFSPFVYRAKSGRLYLYPRLEITVNYTYSAHISAEADMLMGDYVPEAEEAAAEFIVNYGDAQTWYPAPAETSAAATTGGFVIITTDALKDAVQPIVNWEMCKGRDVHLATVEYIDANFSGVDLAEKIRNFLRARLVQWLIFNVLLVGDITDVPMRYTYPSGPDGPCDDDTTPWELEDRVPTDYYYAELSLVDSASWNSNGDGMYGQQGVDAVQFPYEVNVGRIPWSDPDTVEDICKKLAEYEYSTDMDYKLNYLLTGAYFWSDTDNAVVKTYILNHELDPGHPPVRIYEQDPSCWNSGYYSEYEMSRTITREVWGNDYEDGPFGYVNLAGHGSHWGVYYKERHDTCLPELYFHANDRTDLDDGHPSIVFSNACSTAWPEDNNLGKMLLEQGAISFVGSTRCAFGAHGWDAPSDGNCSTLDWLFAHNAVSYTSYRYTVGWSHQRALRSMYDNYNWDNSWWQFFEWNIYGNPDLWLGNRPTSLPNLIHLDRSGWDYPIVPRSSSGASATWCPVSSTLPGNTNNAYFNLTWENNGTYTAPGHYTRLFVDDQWILGFGAFTLSAGSNTYRVNQLTNLNITGGRHTLYYHIDEDEEAWETNESDNCWGHQFVWSPYGLTDDTPIFRAAPPDRYAWGCAPAPHYYNNDGFSFYVGQAHPNKWWSAVGILPYSGAADYDMRLWDRGDYTGSEQGFGGGSLESSASGPGSSDFVIVNNNTSTVGTYYAGVMNANNGTGNFHIEEATSTKVFDGRNGPYAMSSTAVLDIYEYYMSAGNYGIKLDQISGTCDLGMSLYDDETAHCQKSEYMTGGYANSSGDGGDEYMQVTIPNAGFHGLVIWKVDSSDYSKTTTYRIKGGKCATPTQPGGPSPASGASGVSVNADLDWADSTYTEYYEVYFRVGSGSWSMLGTTEASSWTLGPLALGTTYFWQIKAVNICGNTTWSPVWSFMTESGDACEGNFDGDKDVDGTDLATFAADFGRTDCGVPTTCSGDFDKDGDVDGTDLATFAADFGRTDCP